RPQPGTIRTGWNTGPSSVPLARRRAARLNQELGQPQTFGRKLIDTRRRGAAQLSTAISPDVAIADVVGENEEDIRLRLLRRRGRSYRENERREDSEPDRPARMHRPCPPQ